MRWRSLMAIAILIGTWVQARAQSPVEIGLAGDSTSTTRAVSGDGRTVVGSSDSQAIRWTPQSGTVGLGYGPGEFSSEAIAVSPDGSVIVGNCGNQACKWSLDTGVATLGFLPGGSVSVASGVSAKGDVIVGYGYSSDACSGCNEAFRWTASTGMVGLGLLPGGIESLAVGVSGDGSTMVGYAWDSNSRAHAVLWTASGVMSFPAGLSSVDDSFANATNTNGTVVVGSVSNTETAEPFLWSAANGLTELGQMPGYSFCFATAVDSTGAIVGGYCSRDHAQPFVWTASKGFVGLGFLPGGHDAIVYGLSGDGTVAVGECEDEFGATHGCVWTIGAPAGLTPVGNDVEVTASAQLPSGSNAQLSLAFDTVTNSGATSVVATSTGPPPPAGFKLTSPPTYYEISTTATFLGQVRVCLSWVEGQISNEQHVSIFHYEGTHWVDITDAASRDTVNNRVCGNVTSLSPFALAETKYPFSGFFQPVDNAPTLNKARAGSAIPVRFGLGTNFGLDVFATGWPRVAVITCNAGDPVDDVEQTVEAGSSSLSYDPLTNQYIYVWKTDKSWAPSCRQLQVKLNDGEIYIANFSFTR